MHRNKFIKTICLLVLGVFWLSLMGDLAYAQKVKDSGSNVIKKDPNSVLTRIKNRVTNVQRQAAAARAAANRKPGEKGPTPIGPISPSAIVPPPPSAPMPLAGTRPDYLGGVTPNWAWTQPLEKFVNSLPRLTSAGANGLVTPGGDPLGQYLTVAVPDKLTYPGSDYYEIELRQFTEKMHRDLSPTKLQGYVQVNLGTNVGGTANTVAPSPIHYLGPSIVVQKDRPVRIKFTNKLPTGMGGNLFIPVDTTGMGAGMGPNQITPLTATAAGTLATFTHAALPAGTTAFKTGEMVMMMGFTPAQYNGEFMVAPGATNTSFQVTLAAAPAGPATVIGTAGAMFTQNRATLHLHGGRSPWISDGTPHQWTTPATESTSYPKGVSCKNVPDMPDPGPGSITFFYSNQQSARLMFYHDHAWGITRLNVYTGEAAGYVIYDQAELDLITAGLLPGLLEQIPLIIQDKTFVDASTLPVSDPTWNAGTSPGMAMTGDLWYPHVYMPNQNVNDLLGLNAMGRWDYGPWFWPPWPAANPPILMPDGTYQPNLPDVSMTMEAYMDTPLINGTAYPTLNVDPKVYRFRILNAANDRFWNLQLYKASSIVGSIAVSVPGSGYLSPPLVTITRAVGDTTGKGATAVANIDPATGAVTSIDLITVGSSYTANPVVSIAAPPAGGTQAVAAATIYTTATEVGMVPALPGADAFPTTWTVQTIGQPGDILDGRWGGVPDPAKIGPSIIQIGTEGGFLPAPVVWPNIPVGWERNPKDIVVGNVKEHNLFLGCAERADVLIDFSAFPGQTLILYNDAPAAVPAIDSRLDYFTSNLDQTATGGHTSTLPGFGPNTRTIMKITVAATRADGQPIAAYNLAALQAAFATTGGVPGVFAKSQDPILVPQGLSTQQGASTVINGYNSAYGATFPAGTTAYERIQSLNLSFNPLNLTTPAVGDQVGTAVTITNNPKAIAEEFEDVYGRMSAFLGVEVPFTNGMNQTTIFYGYIDPPGDYAISDTPNITTVPVGTAGDGTQIWKITHNGVDTHPLHFHLFDVQLLNRVGWDGAIRPPEENELGWKETVRMNPLEDCIVAMRPSAPKIPFGLLDSSRSLDPTMPLGTSLQFKGVDFLGNPITVTNQMVNFGWEYVVHCHILSHEEMDMMRPLVFNGARSLPAAPVLSVLGGTSATLTWTDGTPPTPAYPLLGNNWGNPAGEVGFRIERSVNGGAFSVLGLALANATSYVDSPINTSNTYQYRVVAFNAAGNSTSNTVTLSAAALPPGAPTSVSVVAGDAQATVTFSAPASNGGSPITLYTVTSSPGGIVATSATVTPIIVPGLTNGTPYTFTITATNAVGTGPGVTVGPVTPSAAVPPAAPTKLTVELLTGPKANLAWLDNATTETGFVVERDSGTGFVALVTRGARTGTGYVYYVDTTVQGGVTYTYRVKAINGAVSSAYSNSVTLSVPTIPAAPSGLSATAVPAGLTDTVTLNWTDNSNNETGFRILRSTSTGSLWTTVSANSTSYVQTNVPLGTTFSYRIQAFNASGSSAWSNTVYITTP